MKKIIYALFILILITGCGEKQQQEIIYDNTYYQVVQPYKQAVGSYSISSYDKTEVEKMLMNLSTNYFKTNNSLFQEGQYLTTEEIKSLLEKYNTTDAVEVDGVKINPKYITTIYEQNYLTTNNNLKGISLAIVVNNKQYYDNNLYKIIDEKIVLDYALEKANELVKYMVSKNLNTRIVVGIFLESNSTLKGTFKYVGENDGENIKLKKVDYSYMNLLSNTIMNIDLDTYNNILAIKNSLSSFDNLYINSIGLYQDEKLVNITITLNKSHFKRSEILSINSIITNYLDAFGSNISINIYFKSNNDIKAYLIKRSFDNSIQTYIMED